MLEKREAPRNMILRSLAPAELRTICASLHRADLLPMERLSDIGGPPQGIWFPESGFISVLVRDGRNVETEVAMVGREGAAGAAISSATRATGFHFVAQQRGVAHFIAEDELEAAQNAAPGLRSALAVAVTSLLAQVASTAHANARGRVVERLARWLLMAHDRVDADVLFLTHEVLAVMLGVRRVGVTNALHILEGERLIRAHRGRIRIVERAGLMAVANGLYAPPRHAPARESHGRGRQTAVLNGVVPEGMLQARGVGPSNEVA